MPKTKNISTPNVTAPSAAAVLDAASANLMRLLLTRAVEGQAPALKLAIERIVPIPRERPLPVRIPAAQTALEIAGSMHAIFTAIGDGKITAGEARKVAAMLEAQRKLFETVALEERLLALEEQEPCPKKLPKE